MTKIKVLLLVLVSMTILTGCKDKEETCLENPNQHQCIDYPDYVQKDVLNLSSSEITDLFTSDGRNLFYQIGERYFMFFVADAFDGLVYYYDTQEENLLLVNILSSLSEISIACNENNTTCVFYDEKDAFVVNENNGFSTLTLGSDEKFTGAGVTEDDFVLIQYNALSENIVAGQTYVNDLGVSKTEVYSSDFTLVNTYTDCFVSGPILFLDSKVYPYGTKTMYTIENGERILLDSFDGSIQYVMHPSKDSFLLVYLNSTGYHYNFYNGDQKIERDSQIELVNDIIYASDEGGMISFYDLDANYISSANTPTLLPNETLVEIDDEMYLLFDEDSISLFDYSSNVLDYLEVDSSVTVTNTEKIDDIYLMSLSNDKQMIVFNNQIMIYDAFNGYDKDAGVIYYTTLSNGDYKVFKNDGTTVVEIENSLFEDYFTSLADGSASQEVFVTLSVYSDDEFVTFTNDFSNGGYQKSISLFDGSGEEILDGIVLSYSSEQLIIVDSDSYVFIFELK